MMPFSLRRTLALTALICLLGALPAAIVAPHLHGDETARSYLLVASGVLAVPAGITCLVSWRIVGRALAGWLGVALIVWGVVVLAGGALSGHGSAASAQILLDQFVGALVAGGLLWRGLHDEEVNAGFSPLPVLTVAACGGFAALVVLRVLASLGALPSLATGSPVQLLAGSVAACLWLWLAVAVAKRRRSTPISGWVPLFALLACFGLVVTAIEPRAGIAPAALAFLPMAVALAGALVRLQDHLQGQDRRQRQLHHALDDSRHQASIDKAQLQEWLHDLRNAVAGLRAADAVLRVGDDRDRAARTGLADAVTAELTRLQALVGPTPTFEMAPVTLRAVLAPIVDAERARGAAVDLSGNASPVLADRHSLTRVVQNVLVNAHNYGGPGSILVHVDRLGPVVELSISDRGPGIAVEERQDVFERGRRGTAGAGKPGTGLGLFVARQLLQAMGGTIAVADDSPGCRIVLTLQAAASELSRADPVPPRRTGSDAGAALLRPAS